MEPLADRVVHFSKKKILKILMAALGFVVLGLWFVFDTPEGAISFMGLVISYVVAGWALLLFFGMLSLFLLIKLFDRRPAIIFTEKGMDDRSGLAAPGYIPWKDIQRAVVIDVKGQQLVALALHNAEPYLKGRKKIVRKMLETNYRAYGAYFAISAINLDADLHSLCAEINQRIQHFG